MIELLKAHDIYIWWMIGISVIIFISTLIAVPWLIVRIPPDYFSQSRRSRKLWADQLPAVRILLLTIKNLFGCILLSAGIIMLLTPGQGLLTMLIGIIFIDLPGKYRLERWITSRPAVLRSINWLRRRSGKDPLKL